MAHGTGRTLVRGEAGCLRGLDPGPARRRVRRAPGHGGRGPARAAGPRAAAAVEGDHPAGERVAAPVPDRSQRGTEILVEDMLESISAVSPASSPYDRIGCAFLTGDGARHIAFPDGADADQQGLFPAHGRQQPATGVPHRAAARPERSGSLSGGAPELQRHRAHRGRGRALQPDLPAVRGWPADRRAVLHQPPAQHLSGHPPGHLPADRGPGLPC